MTKEELKEEWPDLFEFLVKLKKAGFSPMMPKIKKLPKPDYLEYLARNQKEGL